MAVAGATSLSMVGSSRAGDSNVAILAASGAAALALAAGVLTPLAGVAVAILATAGAMGIGVSRSNTEALLVAGTAVAAALLGPGAYSVDARLFGRREIVLSHAPRR